MMISGYEVLGQVGAGTTGRVFHARDTHLDRPVALKQVPVSSVDLLRAEAQRLSQLDDPHVVAVYGFVEEPDAAYLVEEWIPGATLAVVLAEHGRLAADQALGVVRGALLGLAHAHGRGLVHGDVSPSNILVDPGGVSRIIDFGRTGSTPAYRAPEATPEAVTTGTLTPAADVHAAARVLVELLGGDAALPAGLKPVIERATAADPVERYPDAAAFLAALDDAARDAYGTAWWTEAGMAALVAPAVAAVVAVGAGLIGGTTAAAGTAAGTAAGAGGMAGAAGAASSGGGLLTGKVAIAAATATAVAGAGVGIYLLTRPDPAVELVGFRTANLCELAQPAASEFLGTDDFTAPPTGVLVGGNPTGAFFSGRQPGDTYTDPGGNPAVSSTFGCTWSVTDGIDTADGGEQDWQVTVSVRPDGVAALADQAPDAATVEADLNEEDSAATSLTRVTYTCEDVPVAGYEVSYVCGGETDEVDTAQDYSISYGAVDYLTAVGATSDGLWCGVRAPDEDADSPTNTADVLARARVEAPDLCAAVLDAAGVYE